MIGMCLSEAWYRCILCMINEILAIVSCVRDSGECAFTSPDVAPTFA